MYTPTTINTDNVILPEFTMALVEQLAENAHDHWARGRISEGWIYGKSRDDDLKEHPCIIPYLELSDSEKEYDRVTAIESLKAIVVLGYNISENNIK